VHRTAIWPSGPLARPQHTRLLTGTSRRWDGTEKQRTTSTVDPNTAAADATLDTGQTPDTKSTAAAKKKAKTASAKKTAGSKSKPDKASLAAMTPALQGAIETFKKVLANQNIDLAHLTQILDQTPPATTKDKSGKKEKIKDKDKKKKGMEASKDKRVETEEKKAKKKARKEISKATAMTENSNDVQESTTPKTTKAKAKNIQATPSFTATKLLAISGLQPISSEPSPWVETGAGAGIGGSRQDALGQPFGEAKPAGREASTEQKKLDISTIRSSTLELKPVGKLTVPVPRLAHDLDRVLFNPGVYFLQDPRSRVFNFDPYLANIMPIQEFDFNALKQYITSSKDNTLIKMAKTHKKKYTGSTSSMTAMLSHFHYLLSAWRPVNSRMMSVEFKPESSRFTRILRAPAATFLHWKDGCYAIDADKEFDSANILSMLGKSMEKLLTLPKHKFEQYRHANSNQISEEERNAEEAFHYTGFQDFLMRSQLDAYDKRVPGTGMFDLKTRAVVSIRMDAANFQQGLGYEIRHRQGQWESYEREYYDMIRSAFLKYSLQVRMGRMDGIYVAYHNTQRIFGFQYIPLSEMDFALHGTNNKTLGDREYKLSLTLLNELLDRASKRWPEQSLRLHFETRESAVAPFMYVFARPVAKGDIEAVQNAGKQQVEEFERRILGLDKKSDASPEVTTVLDDAMTKPDAEPEKSVSSSVDQAENLAAEADSQRLAVWDEVQQVVEDAMSDEEVGISSVRETIQNALEESSLLEVEGVAETRQYIDALLTAITGVQTPAQGIEADQLQLDQAEDSDAFETAQDTPATSHPVVVDPAIAEQDVTLGVTAQSAESVTTQDRSATNEEAVLPNEDNKDTKRVTTGKSSLSPLKDLIALSAQRLHDRPEAEVEHKGSSEDSLKLKAFEEILGRMITQAKAEQSPSLDPADTSATNDNMTGSESSPANSSALESAEDLLGPEEEEAELEEPATGENTEVEEEDDFELLGMLLTIKNKVNGEYVERPENLTKEDEWDVEYNIEEMPNARAHLLYKQCQARRKTVFMMAQEKSSFESMYAGQLARATNKGREYREKETVQAKRYPVHIYGSRHSHHYRDVFGYLTRGGAGATKITPGVGGKSSRSGVKRGKRDKKKRASPVPLQVQVKKDRDGEPGPPADS